MNPDQHIAITIAGSDPSGGAGIQADLKTFTVLGVYSGAIITCLTAQNSRGVSSWQPVAPGLVKEQIAAVLSDFNVSHVKTGMIGNAEIATAIAEALADFSGELVCDPVLSSSGGLPLLEPTDLDIYCGQLLSRATVITPNLPELEIISGGKCENKDGIIEAVKRVFRRFPGLRAVIVKGGHALNHDQGVIDYLCRRPARPDDDLQLVTEIHPYIKTMNTHGTGCTFASAFTAFHLLTSDDARAFQQTVSFLDRLLKSGAELSLHKSENGRGPLPHHLFNKSS